MGVEDVQGRVVVDVGDHALELALARQPDYFIVAQVQGVGIVEIANLRSRERPAQRILVVGPQRPGVLVVPEEHLVQPGRHAVGLVDLVKL